MLKNYGRNNKTKKQVLFFEQCNLKNDHLKKKKKNLLLLGFV